MWVVRDVAGWARLRGSAIGGLLLPNLAARSQLWFGPCIGAIPYRCLAVHVCGDHLMESVHA
jgi:hypothetical protein